MEALSLNTPKNPVQNVLAVIQQNVTPYAIAAGGALTDMIFNQKYGKNLEPRDVDIFVPMITHDEEQGVLSFRKGCGIKLKKLGLVRHNSEFGVTTERYWEAMQEMLFSVYTGQINGINTDVILIYVKDEDIIKYVMQYFDLDIKTVAYTGNKIIKSEAFEQAFANNSVGILHPHTPMSSFFRMLDANERYGLELDKSFYYAANYTKVIKEHLDEVTWKKEVRNKYHRFLSKAEKIMANLEEISYTDAAVMDTMRGWTTDPGSARNAFQNYLHGKREETLLEIEKIYNPDAQVTPQKASVKDFQNNAEFLIPHLINPANIDPKTTSKLKNHKHRTIVMGADYDTITKRLYNITSDEFHAARMDINGRTVRVGKILTKIRKFINQYEDENIAELLVEKVDYLKYLLDNRLTQAQGFKFKITRDPKALMQISINTPWKTCQSWEPGKLSRHNRHLAANLNGTTALAVLQSKSTGRWVARCLLRLSKHHRAVIREGAYGTHPDLASGLVDIIENELMHRDINVKTRNKANFKAGPFYLVPYGHTLFDISITDSRTDERMYYIKPHNKIVRNPERIRNTARQDNPVNPGIPF